MTAYIQGGGIQGLLGSGEEEPDEESAMAIEQEFRNILASDPLMNQLLGDTDAASKLSPNDKYQLIIAYQKGGAAGV